LGLENEERVDISETGESAVLGTGGGYVVKIRGVKGGGEFSKRRSI
jgi:hypothetical protein